MLGSLWFTPKGRLTFAFIFIITVFAGVTLPGRVAWAMATHAVCSKHFMPMFPRLNAYNPNVIACNFDRMPAIDALEAKRRCPNRWGVVQLTKCRRFPECPNPSYSVTYSCFICSNISDDADREFYGRPIEMR